ncbi:hypothetical protein Taro_053193 [Colocasia esculenta]|uniref:Uncharacterized protein n=1 Tax=Colocasia esculenta TaxID=4460 RepID=A0A843XME9_COLES|nr:hypothetical protein [Colocasia esculenta]
MDWKLPPPCQVIVTVVLIAAVISPVIFSAYLTCLVRKVSNTPGCPRGRVEELLVAEELWNAHTKPFFFPFSSAATCTNRPLEVDQSPVIP